MQKTGLVGYSGVAMTLHWLIAALILYNVGVMLFTPEEVPPALMESHKAMGITILFLSILRLIWRLTHKWPPLSDRIAGWQKALARTTHVLFYVLIIAVPLAGWTFHSAGRGTPVSWLGLFEIPALPIAQSREVAGLFHDVHEIAAFTLIGLLVLHVAGALKHTFTPGIPGISRMLPIRTRG